MKHYTIIYITAIITLIVSSCGENKEIYEYTIQTTNFQTPTALTQKQKTSNQKEFFDMKYVYKSIRIDKSNFSNELTKICQDYRYTNIIVRNKEFLNKKISGDNDIKKYALEFISNTYLHPFMYDIALFDIYNSKYEGKEYLSKYYAAEHIYTERNLALKKARDLLLTIKNKDADIYFYLFLSHFATDSLYYFNDIQNYLKEWKKASGTNIDMLIKKNSNYSQLINYIIEAPNSLRAEKLIADAYKQKFLFLISKDKGYLDIYNENNYNLTKVNYEGSMKMAVIDIIPDIVNDDIMNKYMEIYNQKLLNSNIIYYKDYKKFYNLYNDDTSEFYDDIYFLEFNKNTFVYTFNYKIGIEKIYYFNPLFIENPKYAVYEIKTNYNFRLGNIDKVKSAETNSISADNLKYYVKKSEFINNGNFEYEKYLYYISEKIGYVPYSDADELFFLCDINNDGKEELMLKSEYHYSGGRGGVIEYTLLLKDNLEVDLDSEIGQLINANDFQTSIGSWQKIYTENGKNKMFLSSENDNSALDIFIDNNEIKNKEYFDYISYYHRPKLLWKGNIINGAPEGALKTDASFDMQKAENASDKAIVSDKTLRIANKLISYDYYRKKETLDKKGQEELLEQRRAEIKSIHKKGDIEAIETEMLKILNIE